MSDTLLRLKLSIKQWEHDFQVKHNRVPSKEDIKNDAKIHKLYKAYRITKSKPQKPKAKPTSVIDVSIDSISDAEYDSDDSRTIAFNAELGPTPQAHGKVLSIFDINLTPPESSPMKVKLTPLVESPTKHTEEFKTPTKSVKRIHLLDLTPSRPGTKRGLTQLLEETVTETPQYLSKINKKFDFTQEPSPVALKSSPFHSVTTTPTKSTTVDFQVSPSPLKSHRFLSFGKKMSEIYNDYQNLKTDFEEEAEEVEENIEEEVKETETLVRKKALTQKRTTRRWKIKPRQSNVDDEYAEINLHDEMKKLEEGVVDAEVSDEEFDSDEELSKQLEAREKAIQQEAKSGKKKVLSNNYQRLKINDPRKKAFKRRMRR